MKNVLGTMTVISGANETSLVLSQFEDETHTPPTNTHTYTVDQNTDSVNLGLSLKEELINSIFFFLEVCLIRPFG